MAYNIIIGRDESDTRLFGEKGTIYLGKLFVKMGQTTSLSNKIYLDVARPHIILVSGKRGSGKSYSISVIAESMANLPEEISSNLAVLIFDTMGIFWSMKYPNIKQEDLLEEWDLRPHGLDVKTYIPQGKYQIYKKNKIPIDFNFSIQPNELNAFEWCSVFDISITSSIGILIERVLETLQGNYDIPEIIQKITQDKKAEQKIKDAAENRFKAAQGWGIFDKRGTKIRELIKPGQVSVLDVSCYTDWNIKCLVISLISKKLLEERMTVRKIEEMESLKESQHYIIFEKEKRKMPLVWIMIDEAHEFLARDRKTPATDALTFLLREGRQPGISLVLATQQPGEISRDVITQSDIIISHRVTAKIDVEALNNVMQTYLTTDILSYLNNLPDLKGAALILDDNSERIYPMRVRPKMSWHGGEAPVALKIKQGLFSL